MKLRAFYAALMAALATVFALSLAWEFWLEDRLLIGLVHYHEPEAWAERWQFVATATFFSFLALMGPAIIGTQLIRRDEILRQEVIRLSEEDHLTGLYNRRRISELLENEISRATRYGAEFAVILMDVDRFKAVNDQLGHQAGDRVLTKIGGVISSSVRETDLVGRWGGEEFVIILPETGLTGGLSLAENIRSRIESVDFGEIGRTTASFGVTAFSQGDDIEAIAARADAGLYAAKQGGRNRVEKVTPPAEKVPAAHTLKRSGSVPNSLLSR